MLKVILLIVIIGVGMGFISYNKTSSYFTAQAISENNTFSTAEEFSIPTPTEGPTPTGPVFEIPPECSGMTFFGSPINGNTGTANNDLIFAIGGGDIDGNAGNDCIVGTDAVDNIKGGSGNDVIIARGGDDNIDGDSGDDRIYGGEGEDTIDGGTGGLDYCEGENLRRCEL